MVIQTLGFWKTFSLQLTESLTLQHKQLTGCVTKPNARGTQADGLLQEADAQDEIAISASFISIASAVCSAAGLRVTRGHCFLLCSACRWHGVRTAYAAVLLLKPPASRHGAENERQRLTLIASVELGNVNV